MRLTQKLRMVFWFITESGRDTRRWAREQGLSHAAAVEQVAAHGSVSAAMAALQISRNTEASLRAKRRAGLLDRDSEGDVEWPSNERIAGARLSSSR